MHSLARPVALTGADQAVVATPAVFAGYTLRNSHATEVATVLLYDNASAASGTLLATVGLAAGATADVMYPRAIWAENGIYADISATGTVTGSVRIG